MKEKNFRLGPLALLLSLIALAMSTLAILTFSSARADVVMAERFAKTVKIRYDLDGEGQKFKKDNTDGTFTAEKEGYQLSVEIRGGDVTKWKTERIWEYDDQIHDLWEGN